MIQRLPTRPSEDLSVTKYNVIESQDIWPPTFTLAGYPKTEKFKASLEWLLRFQYQTRLKNGIQDVLENFLLALKYSF